MAYAVDANPESGDAVVGGFTFGLGGAPSTFGSGPGAPVLHSRGSRDGFVTKVRARALPRTRSREAEAALLRAGVGRGDGAVGHALRRHLQRRGERRGD
jgi:hypothetical protein